MKPLDTHQKRMKWLLLVAAWATIALLSKILGSILAEYAHYFPPATHFSKPTVTQVGIEPTNSRRFELRRFASLRTTS